MVDYKRIPQAPINFFKGMFEEYYMNHTRVKKKLELRSFNVNNEIDPRSTMKLK